MPNPADVKPKYGGVPYEHWPVSKLVKEIERLREQVHYCPDCGEYCRMCKCWRAEMEDLHEQIQDLRRDLEESKNLEIYLRAVIDAKEDICNDFAEALRRERGEK